MLARFATILAAVVCAVALVSASGAGQRPPDLSGDWVFVTASSASSRAPGKAGTPGGEKQITTNTVSGAPFNCGRACTIIQKGQTLIIDKAQLASRTAPAPTVTLHLDGRQTVVVDPFSPSREIPVTAKWNGDKLELASTTASLAVTQVVSLEATQLVVVTSFNIDPTHPVSFRYQKK